MQSKLNATEATEAEQIDWSCTGDDPISEIFLFLVSTYTSVFSWARPQGMNDRLIFVACK